MSATQKRELCTLAAASSYDGEIIAHYDNGVPYAWTRRTPRTVQVVTKKGVILVVNAKRTKLMDRSNVLTTSTKGAC